MVVLGSEAVGRALDASAAAVQNMGVDHGGGHVLVAQKLLDGADVVALTDQLSGKGMAQTVGRCRLGDTGAPHCLRHRLLHHGLVQVMSLPDAAASVRVVGGSRENVLPGPLAVGAAVLACQGVRQGGAPEALAQVRQVKLAHPLEMLGKRLLAGTGQHGHPVLAALAVADGDLVALEVDVLDAHVQALQEPEPRAVQQPADEEHHSVQMNEEPPHLIDGQNDRQSAGALGTDDAVDQTEVLLQDLVIQEEQGVESLVLRRGAHALREGEMRKEAVDFVLAHVGGVADLVKEDVPADPADVGLLRSWAVVPHANGLTNPGQQLGLARMRLTRMVVEVQWGARFSGAAANAVRVIPGGARSGPSLGDLQETSFTCRRPRRTAVRDSARSPPPWRAGRRAHRPGSERASVCRGRSPARSGTLPAVSGGC